MKRIYFFKALTWRVLATCATGVITFFFTENTAIVLSVVTADTVVKFVLYMVHEKLWDKVVSTKKNQTK